MSVDPRAALAAFVTALERHLEAASSRRGENDPTVVAAYQDLAEAFDRYDDALMEAYGEVTPLEIYNGDDDEGDEDFEDEDEFDDEDEDDDATYSGLDDEEFDDDEDADDDSDDTEDADEESDEESTGSGEATDTPR